MRNHVRTLLLLALVTCGADESKVVAEYIDTADGLARAACECDYATFPVFVLQTPYESSEACLMDFPLDAAERGCIEGLFADKAAEYLAVLDCRAAAFARTTACVSSKTCTDTARSACYMQNADEVEDCPDLPDDIEAMLGDCQFN